MKVVVFDTETTDLLANSVIAEKHRPHIIEFYAMALAWEDGAWAKVGELEFLAKPPFEISAETTRITGIKPEDLVGAPAYREKAQDVADFLSGADMVVAHNLSFDMEVTDTEQRRATGAPIDWPANKLCTVEATEHLKGYRLNLSALHELLFGEPFAGAHRARVDVEALGRCFVELWARGEI